MADKLALMAEAEKRGMLPPDKAAMLAEARKRGLVSESRPALDVVDDVVRGAADAVTLGTADELSAKLASWTGIGGEQGDYEGNLAAQRARDAQSAPGARLGGQIVGGVGQAALTGNPQSLGRAASLAAAQGAAYGFGSGEGGLENRSKSAAAGSLGGLAGFGAVRGLGNVIAPRVADGVKKLVAEGIPLTPGQMIGGIAKRAEDALTSSPIAGAPIRAAQERGVQALNRAAYDRVLKPIGERLPMGMKAGREAVDHVSTVVSKRYDNLLPRLTSKVDQTFADSLNNLHSLAQDMLPERATQFNKILNDKVMRHFSPNGTISGQSMKEAESELGRLVSQFSSTPDADQRLLGSALRELQDQLRQLVQRSNPQAAAELKALNRSFANLARVQKAAGMTGADDGVFSAGQLSSAVRGSDKTIRKNAYARGKALMQDLSDSARTVLPQKINNSGTAERLLSNPAAAIGTSPVTVPAGMLTSLLYSPAGQKAAQAALASRPQGADFLADAVRKYLASGGTIAGSSLALP